MTNGCFESRVVKSNMCDRITTLPGMNKAKLDQNGSTLSRDSAMTTVSGLDTAECSPGTGVKLERSPAANSDSIGPHTAQCAALIAPYAGYV